MQVVEAFINKASNLERLTLTFLKQGFSLDFAELRTLKELNLHGVVIDDVSNTNNCNVESMDLFISWESEMTALREEDVEDDDPNFYNFWNDCFLRRLRVIYVDFDLEFLYEPEVFINITVHAVRKWFQEKPDLRVKSTFQSFEASARIRLGFIVERGKFTIEKCSEMKGNATNIAQNSSKFLKILKMWQKITPFKVEINPAIDTEKKRNLFVFFNLLNVFLSQ